ncbi:MAG: metallophosphoesterase [Planctomycetes bacterium]|nr:metallophosphoesterase [Planctomycetota bacterium]
MSARSFAASLLFVLCLVNGAAAQNAGFRFLATGDLPYTPPQEAPYRQLLKQSATEDFAFLLHVGDIKSQSLPCSDENFLKIRDLFRAYPKPVVYTPGDNEWTDCHGTGSDPVERLQRIRELFFKDESTLRLKQLQTIHQSRHAAAADFVENYRFEKSGVLFIVAHVVGSRNNRRVDNEAAMKEFEKRDAANEAFLAESFAIVKETRPAAVAVIIHANPDFEQGKEPGFKKFLTAMRGFLAEYKRPVVCIHGDSHYYRIDKPIKKKAGTIFTHFTRMEVFGSPNVAGVAVTVDPSDPEVFSYRPYYLKTK